MEFDVWQRWRILQNSVRIPFVCLIQTYVNRRRRGEGGGGRKVTRGLHERSKRGVNGGVNDVCSGWVAVTRETLVTEERHYERRRGGDSKLTPKRHCKEDH